MNYQRNWNLIERYGITQVDYDEMLAKQDGGCAACRSTVPGSGKGPYFDVDHDHETGKVRGLLCRRCNMILGAIERNRERIVKLEKYLMERS